MLEGRGLDYEGMGAAMGYARDVRLIEAQATGVIQAANREICIGNAALKGRIAQVEALTAALREASPGHPLITGTGRYYRSGMEETGCWRLYDEAHDARARRDGIRGTERALTRAEHAERAEAEILRTPIAVRGWLSSRWYWRGIQHRTKAGAERARTAEAAAARAEVLAS
ncbi:hypothetical protein JHFBIEKO_0261 [Methylobacterium mesophilicum]|uniref:hypothetical protein n=1 Tax=Methylobacterium mesophilicum TaxID=39956 RepID=UPI001EE2426A|nr:hypothetical protein [Methylobacterium mesophilicum]GJE19841.1 hypothetical protein JHFBIEKO_0261 [Methylobacterium mesophilicum]